MPRARASSRPFAGKRTNASKIKRVMTPRVREAGTPDAQRQPRQPRTPRTIR